ncbi:hypothetical protein DFH09DRAFT_1285520 [Mycena vulgaris]|nr:hypothetical protein DFH09DRAFT_1285520 [Mycena vulgaris]
MPASSAQPKRASASSFALARTVLAPRRLRHSLAVLLPRLQLLDGDAPPDRSAEFIYLLGVQLPNNLDAADADGAIDAGWTPDAGPCPRASMRRTTRRCGSRTAWGSSPSAICQGWARCPRWGVPAGRVPAVWVVVGVWGVWLVRGMQRNRVGKDKRVQWERAAAWDEPQPVAERFAL